jgi:hypothetical protein
MLFKSIIVALVFVLHTIITGCTSISVDSTIRDPYIAGLADVITTEVALSHGLVEMNPIGAVGAYTFKGIYLFVLRPDLTVIERVKSDRMATSLWWAAAINNAVQLVVPGAALFGFGVGIISGIGIYQYQSSEPILSR